MSDELDTVNKNLIQQIIKLRQAKAEIQETFNDLEELLDETSHFNSSFTSSRTSKRLTNPSKKDLIMSSTSYSSSDDDYSTDRIIHKSKYKTYQVDSSDDLSCSSSDTINVSITEYKASKNKKHRSKTPPRRRPANIKFSVKTPINTNWSSYSPAPQLSQSATFYYQPSSATDESSSDFYSKSKNLPKPPKPAWVPNGKVRIPYKPTLSSSMSSLDGDKRMSKSNAKYVTPWKHTGKLNPDRGIYLSSQDLRQSVESGEIFLSV